MHIWMILVIYFWSHESNVRWQTDKDWSSFSQNCEAGRNIPSMKKFELTVENLWLRIWSNLDGAGASRNAALINEETEVEE